MVEYDLTYSAKYPFTYEAKKFVEGLGLTLDEILDHPVYGECLRQGKSRFLDAQHGIINSEIEDKVSQEVTILSYPIARLIANITGRSFKTRYASAEGEKAFEFYRDSKGDVEKLMVEFFLNFKENTVGLGEYLKLTENLARISGQYNLVNRKVKDGLVEIDESEKRDLLRERITLHILSPVDVGRAPKQVESIAKDIKNSLALAAQKFSSGDASEKTSPPCINYIISMLKMGEVNHNMLFILATYLVGKGLSEDMVVGVFSDSPAFDENKTRYQLRFLSGERGRTRYSCPTCVKIKSYGLCKGECGIRHPLQFRGKLREK